MTQFNYFTFKQDIIKCPNCNWSGQGKEMAYGEFFEGSYIAEFLCPNCKDAIAFIQFPMTDMVKKWEEENPGKKTGWED
jgi:hypothetical protein